MTINTFLLFIHKIVSQAHYGFTSPFSKLENQRRILGGGNIKNKGADFSPSELTITMG